MQDCTYGTYPVVWKIKCSGKTYDLPDGILEYVLNCTLPDGSGIIRNTRVRSRLRVDFPLGQWMEIRIIGGTVATIIYSGRHMSFIRDLLSTEPGFFDDM